MPLSIFFKNFYYDFGGRFQELFGGDYAANKEYEKKELEMTTNYQNIAIKKSINSLLFKNTNIIVDICILFLKSIKYGLKQLTNDKTRIAYRLKNTNQGFYFEYLNNVNDYFKNIFNSGWFYV
jgi:hypothetical protein